MKIILLDDNVNCKADREAIQKILPLLKYKTVGWRKGPYGRMIKTTRTAYYVDRRSGIFLSGFLPRIKTYFKEKKIKCTYDNAAEKFAAVSKPKLTGITFRKDQIKAIAAIKKNQRGVIKAPPGSGKTVVALGAMSMYPNAKMLFLCHTVELLNQTYEEVKRFGFEKVGLIGDGHKANIKDANIIIALIQSFVKADPKVYADYFNLIFIDECHHCNSRDGQYAKVLQRSIAEIRIGFTATLPEGTDKNLAIEGLLGQVISELTIEEGIKKGIIAKPILNFISVPKKASLSSIDSYQKIYRKGIVENRIRNILLVKEAKKSVADGNTVLIMIKELEHGEQIKKIAKLLGLKVVFVHGSDTNSIRGVVKNRLQIGSTS